MPTNLDANMESSLLSSGDLQQSLRKQLSIVGAILFIADDDRIVAIVAAAAFHDFCCAEGRLAHDDRIAEIAAVCVLFAAAAAARRFYRGRRCVRCCCYDCLPRIREIEQSNKTEDHHDHAFALAGSGELLSHTPPALGRDAIRLEKREFRLVVLSHAAAPRRRGREGGRHEIVGGGHIVMGALILV